MCARCTSCILCVLSVPLYCDARWFLALWQPDRIKTMNHLIMTNWNVIRSRCVCVCVFVSLTLCVWHIAHLTFTRLVTLFMWSIVPTFLWLHCIQSSLVLGVLFLFYSIFHSFLATLLSTASLMCRRNKSTENLLKYHVNIKCILFKFDIFLSLFFCLFILVWSDGCCCYRQLLSCAFIAVNDIETEQTVVCCSLLSSAFSIGYQLDVSYAYIMVVLISQSGRLRVLKLS